MSGKKEKVEKSKGKKSRAKTALIVLAVLCVIGGISSAGSNSEKSTKSSNASATPSPEAPADSSPDPNTSEMIDYLISEARKESASDSMRDEALAYISGNHPNYYTDNSTMEKTMYYGAYLEYAYSDNADYARLGTDVLQAVKYVYRGAEKVEDQSTQSNLNQISKELSTLGLQSSQQEAPTEANSVPTEYKSALAQAIQYSDMMHMSKQGIYDQLVSEFGGQFSAEAAQYAVDKVPADWNENALKSAKSYSDTMHMSKLGIYDQLTSEYGEKFTPEEAQYAVDNLQADYKANALETAKTYQESMNMSPEAIRDQLVSDYGEKFTQEEADYAVSNLS